MNSFGKIDLDGGDLGLGFVIDRESLSFLVRAVVGELSKIDYGPYKFAFRLNAVEYKSMSEVDKILTILEESFPDGIKFYEIAEKKII